MESLLEQQRRYHEERERLVDAMTKEAFLQKKTVFIQFYIILLYDYQYLCVYKWSLWSMVCP